MAGREEQPNKPPSRYSADGKWWWDGEQWQSMEGRADARKEPRAPYEPIGDRRALLPFGVLVIGLTVAAAVALIGVVASMAGARLPFVTPQAGSHSPAPQSTPTTHPTPARSPSPSPRTSPRPSVSPPPSASALPPPSPSPGPAAAYIKVVVSDAQRMGGQIDAVNQRCGSPSSLPACRAALVALQGTVHDFERDLGTVTAPSCLQPADVELRQGLSLLDQGIASAIAGIDQGDPGRMSSGMQVIQQAGVHLNKAAGNAQSASC